MYILFSFLVGASIGILLYYLFSLLSERRINGVSVSSPLERIVLFIKGFFA